MDKVVGTIYFETGDLYVVVNNNRYKLATCKPHIDVHRTVFPISRIGKGRGTGSKPSYSIVFCTENIYAIEDLDEEFFRNVTQFDISLEYRAQDGSLRTEAINNLIPVSLDIGKDWVFEIQDVNEGLKLLTLGL